MRVAALLLVLLTAARADWNVPVECSSPSAGFCFPVISADGRTIAVRRMESSIFWIEFVRAEPPFTLDQIAGLDAARRRLLQEDFRIFLERPLAGFDLCRDASFGFRRTSSVRGWDFSIDDKSLSVSKNGEKLLVGDIALPEGGCEEKRRLSATVWFDPDHLVVVVLTRAPRGNHRSNEEWSYFRLPRPTSPR